MILAVLTLDAAPNVSTTWNVKLVRPLKSASGWNTSLPALRSDTETVCGRPALGIAVPDSSSSPAALAGRVTIRISLSRSPSLSVNAKSSLVKARSVSATVATVRSDPVGAVLVPRTAVRSWTKATPLRSATLPLPLTVAPFEIQIQVSRSVRDDLDAVGVSVPGHHRVGTEYEFTVSCVLAPSDTVEVQWLPPVANDHHDLHVGVRAGIVYSHARHVELHGVVKLAVRRERVHSGRSGSVSTRWM